MSQIIGPFWTKQAKLEGGLDPLGLDRVSDRLTGELMPGISVNVNLARYFSFFSWLFNASKAENQEELLDEIVRAEKVYALSAYLAHAGEICATGVSGGDTAAKLWDIKKQINLDKISWLSNGGVYMGLYKGPLFKMGLLNTDSKGGVTVTNIGKPLAEAFHRAVAFTEWAKHGRSRTVVTRAELEQFGLQACPCSLASAPTELNALRQLFFETPTDGGRILAQSFGFILSLIEQCERYEFDNLNQSFRLAVYYRKIYADKDRIVKFKVLNSLDEIVTRWRSFQSHDYFSFALKSFFAMWLENMFSQPGQRLTLAQFIDRVDNKDFLATLKRLLGIRLPVNSLRELKLDVLINALLKNAGLSGLTAQNSVVFDRTIGLEHDLSEEKMEDRIWEHYQEGGQDAEWCAETLMLLLTLYVRFYHQHLQGQNQPGWKSLQSRSFAI